MSHTKKILITGARDWNRPDLIEHVFKFLHASFPPNETVVINGGCKGADIQAANIARQLKYTVETYPAEWNKYGRSAGPIRNQQMANLLTDQTINIVLAFHDQLHLSKGTKHMVDICRSKKTIFHITYSSSSYIT